jgi:hypothetical protein
MKRAILTALIAASLAAPAQAGQGENAGKPVGMGDATSAPSFMQMLKPGHSLTVTRQCGTDYWVELSAYTWRGTALPGQRWNADHDRLHWGRVTFDGITWTNHYPHQAVLVAAWC